MTRHVIRLVALSVMLLITAAAADVIAQTGDPGTLSIARQGYLFAGGKYATVNGRRVLRERRFAAPERYNDWPQARLHTQWPGKGAPGDPIFDQFLASQMPGIPDFTLQQVLNRDEILALLEKTGPAILLTHSQSGPFGWPVADARPDLVKAILAVEPNGPPFFADDFAALSGWLAKSVSDDARRTP